MIRLPCSIALASSIALALGFSTASLAATDTLRTVSEQSGFKQTGRYDEVVDLCARFAKAYPDAVQCTEFGRTPEGRPMLALVATRSGAKTAQAAHEQGIPVILIQGGIHAGEIDGKDAGFLALREALDGRAAKDTLDKLVLVFVPVFNIDGHERFGRWNRPNQRGPEQMGWRTTAQNYNLNRDYVKVDAPEMKAMLGLMNAWDPALYVDLHVTDGAKFEHDVSIQVEPHHSGDAQLRTLGLALRDDTMAKLKKQGSLPLGFYPSFVTYDDPTSGFTDIVPPPRFSTGYMPLRNRFGLLVETHSWKDYPTRVRITRNTIVDLLELTAIHGKAWRSAQLAADQRAGALGGTRIPLDYKTADKSHTIEFRGYAYTRTPSEVSGALMTRYDETKPQIWKIPLRDEIVPGLEIEAPKAGYLIPPAHATAVAAKLDAHGLTYRRTAGAMPQTAVQSFRAEKTTFAGQPVESHNRATFVGSWKPETRDIGAGALFVPINQPRSRIVINLLEPQAPDSLAAWGEFNGAFEQKEYMEEYVAEEVAREQLKSDPAIAAEFNRKLAAEPEFAKDKFARLQFFARRHSSWDEQFNLYPVLRVDQAPK